MPTNIKVLFWNVEDFGDGKSGRRGNYVPLCNFIAQVVRNVDADVLCLMELKVTAIFLGHLDQLHRSLLNAYNMGGQTCDWYLDWVPGALTYNVNVAPYSPNNVNFTGQARNEGYAVFWKQNIDKFIMQQADSIIAANTTPPGHAVGANVPNIQSNGLRVRNNMGGISFLPGNVLIPAGANQYTLPPGSNVAAPGVVRPGVGVVVPAGPTGGNFLNDGDVVSLGTQISPAGITLNTPVVGVNPIVVPGNYTLTTNLTLTAAGSTLLSQHVLGLILSAKQLLPGGGVANYVPGGANNWELSEYPATAGAILWNGSRRPAFCTIKTNNPAVPAAQRLIPITFYHAPLSAPVWAMARCSISQPLYEAMDQGAAPYISNTRAITGGDFNERLDPTAFPYQVFTNSFANNGAGCENPAAGTQNIRVNQGPPAPPPPAFPPQGVPPTNADNPRNKTTVQLRHPIVPPPGTARLPVLSNVFAHYRRSAIDNVFYRGFTAAQAPRFQFRAVPMAGGPQVVWGEDVYDLVRAVCRVIPNYAGPPAGAPQPNNFFIPPAIINAFNALPVWALIGIGPAGLNDVLDPFQLLADINLGIFLTPFGGDPPAPPVVYANPPAPGGVVTRQRRAAEFIKLFVSDHLPVIFRMRI